MLISGRVGQRRDGTELLFYNARPYDPGLGQFFSPDTIVPGTASGVGGAAATVGPDAAAGLAALTVGFHEPVFGARLGVEHRVLLTTGFFGKETPRSAGPANPQALNRYAYVLNNPVRYTDPTGHATCGYVGCGGEVVNNSNRPVKVLGSVRYGELDRESECQSQLGARCECDVFGCAVANVEVVLQPGESSIRHSMADVDDIVLSGDGDDYLVFRVGNHEQINVTSTDGYGISLHFNVKVRLPDGTYISLNRTYVGVTYWILSEMYHARNDPGLRRGKQAYISECTLYSRCYT